MVKHITRIGCGAFIVLLALFPSAAIQAQTLDDWKAALAAAKDSKGCLSIPYSNRRDQCTRAQAIIDERCAQSQWSCKGLLETKSLRGNIQSLKERIEGFKTEKERLSSQRSSATTDDDKRRIDGKNSELEKTIYERTKQLDELQKSLETDISDINIRLEKARVCLDARMAVQAAFADATSTAQSESDPEVRAIVKDLVPYWAGKRTGHEEQIQNVKEGVTYCNQCKNGEV